MLGVNYLDRKPGALRTVMTREKINWRTFDDSGAIHRKWNSPATPTMFIIDHKGTIRRKWVGKASENVIDTVLEGLIEESEQATVQK